MRRSRRGWAAALTATIVLGACGGGSKSASSSSTSSPVVSGSSSSSATASSSGRTPEQLDADRRIAQSVVLQQSDFPAGWRSSPRGASSSDAPEVVAATKTFAECLGVDPSLVSEDSDPTKARAKSNKFKNGDQEAEATATVHDTVENQDEIVTAFRKPAARDCFDRFLNTAFSFALAHPDPGDRVPSGVEIGKIEVDNGEVAGFHGDPVQFRTAIPVTVQGQTIPVFNDFVFVVKGRTSLSLTFQNVQGPFPEDLEVELANKAIDRIPEG